MMQKRPVYNITVSTAAPGVARFVRFFLSSPPPHAGRPDFGVPRPHGEIEAAVYQANVRRQPPTELRVGMPPLTSRNHDGGKSIQRGESGTTINEIVVAGVQVGSINSHCFLALHKAKRRGRK